MSANIPMGFLAFPPAAAGRATDSRLEWEEVDCLLCGCTNWKLIVEAPDNLAVATSMHFAMVRCDDCGLCFTNPRPTVRAMERFYPPAYRPRRAPKPTDEIDDRDSPRLARWCPRGAERAILHWHGRRRLLDFGCGGGAFMQRMHRRGWSVTGLDVSASAVTEIQGELGLPALVGTLPHAELAPRSFDVITMWHSLEHVHHPMETLREAHDLLDAGGKLLIAVPNIESAGFQWYQSAWFGLDLPRHLTHFSPGTLRWMLERAGFAVGPVRMVRQSSWLRSSARLLARQNPNACPEFLLRKPLSRLVAAYTQWTGQADCLFVAATVR
jgi:SAM-dependent methyltransferase